MGKAWRGCVLPGLLLVGAAGCGRPSHESLQARPAVRLVAGVGNARFAVRTSNGEARAYFEQGLNYFYAFNFEEAKRSFARAAELDPRAAMPWWGVAMAVGPNYNDAAPGVDRRKEASEALAKGAALANDDRERGYLAALASRYDGAPEYRLQGERYAAAMGALHAKYPEDEEAAVLYAEALMDNNAWNLWGKDGVPRGTTPAIVDTLQGVLARDPAIARGLPKGFSTDMGTPGDVIFKLALLVARARVAEAAGGRAGAIATWRDAVALQDKFGYSEPPDWYYPVRESLGGALLRAGRAREAEAVFREDLRKNVGNGRSLFGVWQARLAEGRGVEAAQAEGEFRRAWRGADTGLSVAGL